MAESEDLDIGPGTDQPAKSAATGAPLLRAANLANAVDDFQRKLVRSALLEARRNWAEAARSLPVDGGNVHRAARRLGSK